MKKLDKFRVLLCSLIIGKKRVYNVHNYFGAVSTHTFHQYDDEAGLTEERKTIFNAMLEILINDNVIYSIDRVVHQIPTENLTHPTIVWKISYLPRILFLKIDKV